ncbi:MAG: sulfotransferase [Pseudomonadota bacterium]
MGRFRHVFIVTYGRTGSTLLMQVLNAIEGYYIKGESSGIVYSLAQTVKAAEDMLRRLEKGRRVRTVSALYGAQHINFALIQKQAMTALNQIMYRSPRGRRKGRYRVYGFKEVEYDLPDLAEHLDFLSERFTASAFIFLTRDHEEVAKSGFWQFVAPRNRTHRLNKMEERFRRYAFSNASRCFSLDYADLEPDGARLEQLFQFLGEDPDREKVRKVFEKTYSYGA